MGELGELAFRSKVGDLRNAPKMHARVWTQGSMTISRKGTCANGMGANRALCEPDQLRVIPCVAAV